MADQDIPVWQLVIQASFAPKQKKQRTARSVPTPVGKEEQLALALTTPPPIPPAPSRPDYAPVLRPPEHPPEDYTGAVCLLHGLTLIYPVYREVLVDADDLAFLGQFEWRLAAVGKARSVRVVRYGDNAYLHRLIMSPGPREVVDHRYHNALDNRRRMLRNCTRTQNNANSHTKSKSSKYRGVSWNKKAQKWVVQGRGKKNRAYGGRFDDEIEAARAYNALALEEYGEFAFLNPV